VNSKASDLVVMLERITTLKQSPLLTDAQRQVMLSDLVHDLPLEMFSTSFKGSREIVKSLLEDSQDGRTKTKGKTPTKEKSVSEDVGSQEEKHLLCDPDVNSRGKGAEKRMVNKTTKKRREAERSS